MGGAALLSLEPLLALDANIFPLVGAPAGLLPELDVEHRVVHPVVTSGREEQSVAVDVDRPVDLLGPWVEQVRILLLDAEHEFRPLLVVLQSRAHAPPHAPPGP